MNTKIYFVCPNNKQATGGVKQIYRQVEILTKNGFNACVLHEKIGKKERWFDTTGIPIKYSPFLFKKLKYMLYKRKIGFIEKLKLFFLKKKSKKIEKDAILVFPEIYGNCIHKIEPDIKKVIFNQNCFYTFNGYHIEENLTTNPYTHPKTLASIVVSENSRQYLEYTFSNAKIFRLHLGINHKVFYLEQKKEKQICFMPRKLSEEVNQVINILKLRNNLNGWKLVPIDNKTEAEVAHIMQKSAISLCFNHKEGFGLPPVEAMACGCYVIGYQGKAGVEYFNSDFSSPIEDGNIIQYAQKVEEIIALYEQNSENILQKGKQASEFVLSNYSFEKEERETVAIWKKIIQNKQ
ncbi:glycosyltransferase [Capnocytophaga catalasegens]|uniref:Glycosyl transferase family 1 domain-containing protein n=1 Tax=Capnocytophaga catalasegens TaxID=1004260 RepID=A0AAV5AY34_9FLAO|nr:glycosyltransferase [Capnocytophaga catalasegens]GIZ14548.1 hypothetical protein RCZ03_05490 [Capnocytophaga catalasegens]GJM50750.1 hypothetical protein RCZ15_17230 [Capnocytophaga catalasegens]GJM51903.1 hypothetical protein RCZ16_02210 [Capnocytophaga catalasegens]